MNPLKVAQTFRIESYESDLNCSLKPFFLQNHVQELAYRGSEFCGASYEQLRGDNLFWALNRIHLQVLQWPRWGDEVTMETWSRAKAGPLWHRNFRMYSPSHPHEPLMLGTSAWTMLDVANRSICRDEHGFNPAMHLEEDTLPFCSKTVIPREVEMAPSGTHRASFSELDTNAHVNNCMYTQWSIDQLPLEYLKEHTLRDLQICYYHELHYGDEIVLLLGRQADTWFVQGMLEDAVCFVVRMEFDGPGGRILQA